MPGTTKSGLVETGSLDLTAPERHILEKLLVWKDRSVSLEEFRSQTEAALQTGWNNSGPLRATGVLAGILQDLEYMVAQRLLAERLGH